MIDTYYERLGVAPDATDEELRTAYRHRARQLHPDARHELTAGPMAELNEAWRVLRDPERRRTYDAGLPGANGGAAAERGGVRVWDDQLEVSPPVAARGGRGLLVAVMLGILAAIFVFTAFARTPETRPAAPRVDGYLSVGDCVAARPGMVVEVTIDGIGTLRNRLAE